MWYETPSVPPRRAKKLAEGKHGFGYAFSAETGRRIALNDRWSLTPQAQLMWSSVSFGRFRDVWDTRVSLRNGDSLTGRLGIAADYRHSGQDARGRPASTNVYVIANLYQELLSDTRINVAGLDFRVGQRPDLGRHRRGRQLCLGGRQVCALWRGVGQYQPQPLCGQLQPQGQCWHQDAVVIAYTLAVSAVCIASSTFAVDLASKDASPHTIACRWERL